MRTDVADIGVEVVERRVLHRDPHAYCAHPHLAVATDGAFLLVFNRAPRRMLTLHPPQDPEFRNVLMRSEDEGRSWSAPAVVPAYDWSGVECAGLTVLRNGRVLLNQWRFEWLPLPLARTLGRADLTLPGTLMRHLAASPELDSFTAGGLSAEQSFAEQSFPWARGGGETVVHLSDDGGRTFITTSHIDTLPFSGGYGLRGALELPDGDILLPLSDVPHYRAVFTVRSRDGGDSWGAPMLVAAGQGHEFEEPAPLLLPSGRMLMLLRDNISRILHAVASDDGGLSWSKPVPTGIGSYPAQLIALPGGEIACVSGQRSPPFGIMLHLSRDQGLSWGAGPMTLVGDLPTKDLGYPTVVRRSDGNLMVVFYARDREGVTGIHSLTARLS
ncbi:hypothetical protein GCM10007874_27090 [Labrys miyagiensis]|uniref:Sialidase domain-containing protein n=1 Tax=Labrys miyagiensis TaxID=346912 RepID=A0ABQ6CN99_9HYPH|nr:sialidase family protein [Labrys miyagiensis]GLS19692.1 hypothetical protein GCM10007874_27090 [Labrys miyagiensis]